MTETTTTDYGWSRAYLTAFVNAILFFILSTIARISDISVIGIHVSIALVFFAGSIGSFFLLIRNGGGLAAISFFVLGTGIFFGWGTAYSTVAGTSDNYFLQYPPVEQAMTLPTINFLNATSVVLVLLAAWPLSRRNRSSKRAATGIKQTLYLLKPLTIPMLLLSFPVFFLKILTFPLAENLLLRNLLSNAEAVILLSIVLCCMRWSSLQLWERVLPITIFMVATILGFLSAAKTEALLPALAVVGALWLDGRSRKLASILAVSSIMAYFLVIAPICNSTRSHPIYDARDNTVTERFEIMLDVLTSPSQYAQESSSGVRLLNRFAGAPMQAFLIERYDSGAPGNSMTAPWKALVPRMFWPDKPNITRFGTELDGLFYGRADSQSALAPSYSAEAYWNGGWPAVVFVSLLLGLEFGWLTSKWNKFVQEGMKHVGILALSIRVILATVWVETWVVATYVGGFVTLVVLIKAADFVIPRLVSRVTRSAPKLAMSVR